jgi:hypothetical protein
MSLPPIIGNKLSNPLHNVMDYLGKLSLPSNLKFAAPGESSVTGNTFGTVIAARRNFKPFIVGLIPPDVPVNFIPFKRIQDQVANLSVSQKNKITSNNLPLTSTGISQGNKGDIKKTRTQTGTEEFRKAVRSAIIAQAGFQPSEEVINLITAHACKEQSGVITKNIPSWCYNYGNVHASGKGKDGGPPSPPKGGTYFLSTDYTRDKTPYQVYYVGATDAETGVNLYVNTLVKSYPGTLVATTPEEYNNALLNGVGGRVYYEADPKEYGSSLDRLYTQLALDTANGKYGGQLSEPAQSPDNTNDTETEQNPRFLMSTGSVTSLESDPAGDRIGKLVEYDPSRDVVVKQQIKALRDQIAIIQNTPGLLMLVNPSNFAMSHENSVDNSVKGRKGNITHVWFEKPISINGSGVTAGQYVISPDGDGGITNELRVYSASYQNLLSLFAIYKTNGIIFSGAESGAESGIRQLGYSVFIYYDNHIYVGSFDSFEIQDSGSKPHNMSYSFKFNVRYDFDVGNDGRFTDFEVGVQNGYFAQTFRG